jgi:hypothetical protein
LEFLFHYHQSVVGVVMTVKRDSPLLRIAPVFPIGVLISGLERIPVDAIAHSVRVRALCDYLEYSDEPQEVASLREPCID